MSEELLQRGLNKNNPSEKIGKWDYYNIGATSVKALKEANIIRNIDYKNIENKKVDALIVSRKNVIAIIEFKQPKEFKTKTQKNKAISQEIEVAKSLGAKIVIATDTINTIWINSLTGNEIKYENENTVKENFIINDDIAKLIEKINYSINEKNDYILPKTLVNPTDLAKSIWQDIWSVSGATPENCLYTFVELFIFKYLSDLKILKDIDSFDFLYSLKDKRTNDEILQYYADNIRKKIKELFPYNSIDNTTIINGTIFVSKDQKAVEGYSTVFIKVLKRFKEYGKLEHIDYDFKSQLFESFLKESISKKNWGQFFTPLKIIRAIEKIAKDEIKVGATICDPACGVGKFLLEPIKSRLEQFYQVDKNKVLPKITIRGFDKGFDKDEQKTIILAKANMLIYFSEIIKDYPNHTVEFGKIFNDSFTLKTNSILGTLRDPIKEEYDLILTNPPYVTSGSSNLKDEIKKDDELKAYYKINAIGVEGLFMEWIIRALKPNGKAFIVVPDGIFNRQNDKNLREFIKQECIIDGIISLPLNTFFTTNKKTYILCITKKNSNQDIQTNPVFTYLVSEIGESRDVYRFNIEQNDLDEATELFNFFKGNKSIFHKFNKDPRCKIFPITEFDANDNWCVDRWWNKEEKIALGIVESENIINFEDFPYFIENISETILSFKNDILELKEKKNSCNIKYKEVSILEKDFFVLKRGKRITKDQIERNKGNIPVYSSSKFGNSKLGMISFNFLQQEQLVYETEPSILFNLDGSVGYCFIKKDKIYSFIDVVASLKILDPNILLDYIKIQLEREILRTGANYSTKFYFNKLYEYNIKFKIPILSNGKFDIEKQTDIIKRYNLINELKQKIIMYKNDIKNIKIEIKDELQDKKVVQLNEIIDFSQKTNNSKFTKSFINKHKGNIPVYSASDIENYVSYGYVQDNLPNVKYFDDCMTWNIDGSIGKVFIRTGKFSLSEKVIPLKIFTKYEEELSKNFLKYSIENEALKENFGFANKAGKSKLSNLKIEIPISENNKFDLKTQIEIANKYQKIEDIKQMIILELEKIENIKIEI
ncbi:N-6 DNA methylase [Aliarcobacter butzleri]|uniref:N-6 DNA methylase n=1 Tax=Aliarcobacter butzleri TaxID=28197 RepID=UPI003AF80A7F